MNKKLSSTIKCQINTTGDVHQRWGPNFGRIRFFLIGEAHSDDGGRREAFIVRKYRIRKRQMRWRLDGKLCNLVFLFIRRSTWPHLKRPLPGTNNSKPNGTSGKAAHWRGFLLDSSCGPPFSSHSYSTELYNRLSEALSHGKQGARTKKNVNSYRITNKAWRYLYLYKGRLSYGKPSYYVGRSSSKVS